MLARLINCFEIVISGSLSCQTTKNTCYGLLMILDFIGAHKHLYNYNRQRECYITYSTPVCTHHCCKNEFLMRVESKITNYCLTN